MTPFLELSDLLRALFALWALLLCLVNIGSAVLSAVRKHYLFTAFALVLFAPCYFLWQVIFELSLFSKTEQGSEISFIMGVIPWIYWLMALAVLTAAAFIFLGNNIQYDKTHLTPGAIKLYLDQVPCGICCWRESGRVLFSNICMNRLCVDITGDQLLNGNQFRDAVTDNIMILDGKVWRFACREMELDGEPLYEMIASDITSEYAKTEALKNDKAELSHLNSELRDYYLSIDESVRRQEILQAKMNIHDEMNRLMLSTMAADKNNTSELDGIFSLWEQNALLLCMEADKKTVQFKADSVDSLAKAIGLNLIRRGELPPSLSEKQKELFFFTSQEAVVNAVKHARAKNMEISFEQVGEALCCRFTNDGAIPQGEVRFEGGLANIALLAEDQGASLNAEVGDGFTLVLRFENQPIG